MSFRFRKHYTLDEARRLLPQLRQWLAELQQIRGRLQDSDQRLSQLVEGGNDIGGAHVHTGVRLIASLNDVLGELRAREIQLKDIDRGLVDFPAVIAGREVFLCWELDEEDIEFWHDIDAGYAGRERL